MEDKKGEVVWIKWWENKNLLTIVLTALLSVACGAVSAVYIPIFPWNLIVVIIISGIGGGIIYRTGRRIIDDFVKSKNKE